MASVERATLFRRTHSRSSAVFPPRRKYRLLDLSLGFQPPSSSCGKARLRRRATRGGMEEEEEDGEEGEEEEEEEDSREARARFFGLGVARDGKEEGIIEDDDEDDDDDAREEATAPEEDE